MTKTKSEVKLALAHCASNKRGACRGCPYDGGHEDCGFAMSRDSLEYIMELEKKVKELAGDEGVQQPGETVPELPELSGDGCSV